MGRSSRTTKSSATPASVPRQGTGVATPVGDGDTSASSSTNDLVTFAGADAIGAARSAQTPIVLYFSKKAELREVSLAAMAANKEVYVIHVNDLSEVAGEKKTPAEAPSSYVPYSRVERPNLINEYMLKDGDLVVIDWFGNERARVRTATAAAIAAKIAAGDSGKVAKKLGDDLEKVKQAKEKGETRKALDLLQKMFNTREYGFDSVMDAIDIYEEYMEQARDAAEGADDKGRAELLRTYKGTAVEHELRTKKPKTAKDLAPADPYGLGK